MENIDNLTAGNEVDKIEDISITTEMKSSFLSYAMSVIVSREIGRASCRERV